MFVCSVELSIEVVSIQFKSNAEASPSNFVVDKKSYLSILSLYKDFRLF